MTKLTVISGAIPSDTFQHGGQVTNQFVLLFTGSALDTEEDIRINTTFKFYSGKFAMYDNDPTLSHKVFLKVENIATGLDKSITIRDPTVQDDFMVTESQNQVLANKTLGTNTQFSAGADFNLNAITEAVINASLNTLTNIPNSAILQITDKAKLHSTLVYNDQINTYGVFSQFFKSSTLKIQNPALTFNYTFVASAITASRLVTLPLLTADDIFVFRGIDNTFTTLQTIQADIDPSLSLYKTSMTGNIGLNFEAWSSTGVKRTYATIDAFISSNVNTAEATSLLFQVMNAGVLQTKLQINSNGNLGFGHTFKAYFDPNLITTSDKIFTLPNLSGKLVTEENANIFTNLQKITNTSSALITLNRQVNTLSNGAGVLFSLRNTSSIEINYAAIYGLIGGNTGDNVAGTEKGGMLLQILQGGALTTKLFLSETGFESTGMVPTFTVPSSDLNSMFIYRPVNSAGTNQVNFDLQNTTSVRKTFGQIGIRSSTATAGAEIGSFMVSLMEAGAASALMLQVVSNHLYLGTVNKLIFNNSGLTADRLFIFPNLAGQVTVNEATQTLINKTLTSPTINGTLTTTGAALLLSRTAIASNAEAILQLKVSDDATSYLQIDNASATDAVFSPRITSYNAKASDNAAVGLYTYVNVAATSDTADSVSAVTIFDARRADSTAIQFRRLFQFRNAVTNVFEIYTDKFNFTNKKLINAVLNIDEVTLKHSTTNLEGDVIAYNATSAKYLRVPQGGNNKFLGVVAGVFGYYTPTGVNGVLALAGLTDDVNIGTLANGHILVYRTATSKWVNEVPTFSGETNTASNVGSLGTGLFKIKTGVDLEFYKIHSPNNLLTVALSGTDYLALTVNEANMNIANMTGSIGDSRITGLAYSKLTAVPDASATVKGIVQFATNVQVLGTLGVAASDSRLSDARTPNAHAASHASAQPDALSIVNLAGNIGDSRITDLAYSKLTAVPATFAPSAHAASHLSGGTDPLAAATELARGTVELATSAEVLAGLVVQASDTRLSNSRVPTAHASTHSSGQSDAVTLDNLAGTLSGTKGGTGKATITQHALLKGGATNTYSEIVIGTTDQVLAVVAGTPAWKSLNAERTGKATASGNGTTTVFNIAHGLGVDPYCAFPQCSSHSIAFTYTTTTINIVVTFVTAPPTGTNNVIFHWRALA